jgi:hypothetical protein
MVELKAGAGVFSSLEKLETGRKLAAATWY